MSLAFVSLLVLLTGALSGVILSGVIHWRSGGLALRVRLAAARRPIRGAVFDARELEALPAPVRRYLGLVLRPGQPLIAAVDLVQTGEFNLNEADGNWRPFAATQRVVTSRPGFVWEARIALFPGVAVRVRDAYAAGEGVLHAAVLGWFSLARVRGAGEIARGELMRFFAEAAWYPTAFLPSQGVRWEAVDEHSARGTLRDGDIEVAMVFRFGADGMLDTIRAEARGRAAGGKTTAMPWQCRVWNYTERDGMRVPLEGEAAWIFPEGVKPYWRGKITSLAYEFAPAG
jgi:hypothetical protein